MKVDYPEIRSRSDVRARLIFLIENRIQKGRLALLYHLYKMEIHSISLVGASKIITTDLGYPVGIQTIRTLRKKSQEFEKDPQTEWRKKENEPPWILPSIENRNQGKIYDSDQLNLEGFKPLDVFSEEFIKKQSTIKWAKPNNS